MIRALEKLSAPRVETNPKTTTAGESLQQQTASKAPAVAARQSGFDPIVFAAETFADLEAWAAHFDGQGIGHSGVLRGMLGVTVARTLNA